MPEINWNKLINPEYWLEGVVGGTGSLSATPVNPRDGFFFWFYLYLFSILFLLGVVLRTAQAFLHPEHPLQSKLPFWGNNLMGIGIAGLFWFFFRQTQSYMLGSRLWLLVGLAWFLTILGFALNYLLKFFPLEIKFFQRNVLKKS